MSVSIEWFFDFSRSLSALEPENVVQHALMLVRQQDERVRAFDCSKSNDRLNHCVWYPFRHVFGRPSGVFLLAFEHAVPLTSCLRKQRTVCQFRLRNSVLADVRSSQRNGYIGTDSDPIRLDPTVRLIGRKTKPCTLSIMTVFIRPTRFRRTN
jgi:hypothetical protein